MSDSGSSDSDLYLDRVLVGGRESADIRVVDYDPTWPDAYARHRDRIRRALGHGARRLEHIGSTSVPRLAAKPVVDVLVVVDDVEDEDAYLPALVRAGYELRVREPGHRMVRTPARDVHVHLYADGSPEIDAYLDLRDRLRVSAADRERYATVKRELARRRWSDMNHYADAKSSVIREILARARGDGGLAPEQPAP